MPQHTRLQGVVDFDRASLPEQIESNLAEFFNWACVQAGGFVDVPVSTPGTRSMYDDETLAAVRKPGVADGRIWQAEHPAWCHETGLEDGLAPTIASGVYVDGVYHPTSSTTGPYAHRLDFVRGLAVFAAPIPTASTVQAAYSYRRANFLKSGVPWFREVVLDYYLSDQSEGGVLGILDESRVQTPAVVVESAGFAGVSGYEMGGSSRWTRADVLFYVLASNKDDRDRLAGVIVNQYGKTIAMYDANARGAAGDYPLDALGSPLPGSSDYPTATGLYPYNAMRFSECSSVVQPTRTRLFMAICRARMELVVSRA